VSQAQNWVERAKNGEVFVYVSDAGTPGISDPGALLVDAFHQAGLEVRSIPGPSSAILAVALSGFSGAFSFLGFLPRQDSWQEWKENLRTQTQGGVQLFVGFESPKRILTSLEKIRLAWGDESHQLKLFIGKELTKKFEKHWRGNLDEVIEALREEQDQVGALGEWVWAIQWVVVRPIEPPSEWERALKVLIHAGVSVSESAKLISKEWDISRHVAYEKALQFKNV
jgi:16S rRNA (cytidine1402-2'-O)-methyltransferase